MKTEPRLAEEYRRRGWWSRESAGEMLRRRAATLARGIAYIEEERQWTWAEYDAQADEIAELLAQLGVERGDRVAVYLPDSALQHATFVATERIGAIAVGVPGRADAREVTQLVARSGARTLVLSAAPGQRDADDIIWPFRELGAAFEHHLLLCADGGHEARTWRDGIAVPASPKARASQTSGLAPDDVWMLNFTSGTTGLPKAVQQTQNRWYYLAGEAGRAAQITEDDRILCAVPGPYGFGIWTGHMLPLMHGIPCCLTPRFSADETLRMIERHQVSVLACVTTQLVMMMSSPLFETLDLSSLRVAFTGGERVPTAQAARWEEATGSRVLQFYGSNEAGPFSCTSLDDNDHTRLTTAGRVVPGVRWQLLESEQKEDDRGPVTVGQATLQGPGAHAGYWNDDEGNKQLWTDDGYLILPDVVAIAADKSVRVVGRKSDIIIRGGKNISAAVIEQGIEAHPDVRSAVAVPVPDPTFGERIGVAVVLHDPGLELGLEQLNSDLLAHGVAKDHLPEHLRVVPEIPTSFGAKADKQRVKTLFLD